MATWWCLWWYPIHERFCIGHFIILLYLPELRHRLLPLLCVFRVPKKYFAISQRFHLNRRRIGDADVITDHARLLFWWGWLDHQTWQSFFPRKSYATNLPADICSCVLPYILVVILEARWPCVPFRKDTLENNVARSEWEYLLTSVQVGIVLKNWVDDCFTCQLYPRNMIKIEIWSNKIKFD